MEENQFWGVTLDGTKKEIEWNPELPKKQDRPAMKGVISLVLNQAVLGESAKDGDVNVVQVEALGPLGEMVKLPVLYLKGGSVHQQAMNVIIPEPPAKITLSSGTGPVHLVGVEKIDFKYAGGDIDDEEELDDEELEEEDMDDEIDEKVDDDLDDDEDLEVLPKGRAGKGKIPIKAKNSIGAAPANATKVGGPKGKK